MSRTGGAAPRGRLAPGRPILCLVTDRASARRPLAEAVAAAARAGADWIQVRARELEGAALLEHAETLARAAREAAPGVRMLLARRVDVVLAAGLDGVHLGFDGMPPETARALLGEEALVGVAAHAPAEVAAAARAGAASHAQLAPLFDPKSKTASRPPLGLAPLREAARAGLPLLAQGGLTPERAAACVDAGAAGVCVTGAILAEGDPGAATAAFRRALDAAAPASA